MSCTAISCTLPAKQRLQGSWWEFPGLPAVGSCYWQASVDTVWHRNSGGSGTPLLPMTSVVPGILESPELLPGIQHFSFINVTQLLALSL